MLVCLSVMLMFVGILTFIVGIDIFSRSKRTSIYEKQPGLQVPPGYKFGDTKPGVILGNGWKVSLVLIVHPIALVVFTRNFDRLHARFNVEKQLFIDPPPVIMLPENRRLLAKSIVQKSGHPDFKGVKC